MLVLFLQGLVVGVIINFSLGHVPLYCIKTATKRGFKVGMAAVLGMTLADLVYAAIMLLGLQTFADYIYGHQKRLLMIGGVIILSIGLWEIRQSYEQRLILTTKELPDTQEAKNMRRAGATAAGMILLSPGSLLIYAGVLALLPLPSHMTLWQDIVLLTGIGIGAISIWSIFLYIISKYSNKVSDGRHRKITYIMGIIFMIIGIVIIIKATTSG